MTALFYMCDALHPLGFSPGGGSDWFSGRRRPTVHEVERSKYSR